MILLLPLGCAPSLGDTSFLRLRGAVSSDIHLDGDDAEIALVWATAVAGELCVEVDPLPFTPGLFSYEVEIEGPPTLDGSPCVPQPIDLQIQAPIGWGILTLIDPDVSSMAEVSADPGALLEWFAGDPGVISDVIRVQQGRLAAATTAFALMVDAGGGPPGGAYCRFDQLIEGLTLYQDRGLSCGGWVPAAPAGDRTEFQGIDLVPPVSRSIGP